MSDIKTIFDATLLRGDFGQDVTGLVLTDLGLDTAVIISLFTDRRANDYDELPDENGGRRGWWGDALLEDDGDQIGSRLWLISRELQTDETLNRAQEYVEEALAWIVDKGVAQSVSVECWWVRAGMLGIHVVIKEPGGIKLDRNYEYVWSNYGL